MDKFRLILLVVFTYFGLELDLCANSNLREPTILNKNSSVNSVVEEFIVKSKSYRLQYKFIEADQVLDTALMIALKLGHHPTLAAVYSNKGTIKKLLGDQAGALEFYLNALKLYELQKDWKSITSTYVDLAEFYRKIMQYPEAVEFIVKAKSTYYEHNFKDTVLLIKIYNRSAAINNEYNPDINATIQDSRKALKLATLIGDSSLMGVSYNELGFTYKNLMSVDSSEYFYLSAEKMWMSTGKYSEALRAMENRAQLYAHNNYKYNQVIPLLERIVFLNDSLKANYSMYGLYHSLHYLNMQLGDTIKAYLAFTKYHDETTKLFNVQNGIELHKVNTSYKNEKILNEFKNVSRELEISSQTLEAKRREQNFTIIFLVVLVFSLSVITFLLFRLKKSNSDLAKKNSEKDSLIQEIHHRVKNNLQFINSLMSMQLKTSDSPEDNKTLTNTSRRIQAMALVHEMLYNQSDKEGISIKAYLEELGESLNDLVNADEEKVKIRMQILEIDFDVADAISLGMIASELISNSMKHAFKNIPNPEIFVQLNQVNNEFEFAINDNGIGFVDSKNERQTLGLRLVDIFSRQLKGEYSISGKGGFEFKLTFKRKRA